MRTRNETISASFATNESHVEAEKKSLSEQQELGRENLFSLCLGNVRNLHSL